MDVSGMDTKPKSSFSHDCEFFVILDNERLQKLCEKLMGFIPTVIECINVILTETQTYPIQRRKLDIVLCDHKILSVNLQPSELGEKKIFIHVYFPNNDGMLWELEQFAEKIREGVRNIQRL